MKKYSVPFYYVVSVDVEADSIEEAREKASNLPFIVSVSHDLEITFSDSGDVYQYDEEELN